MSPRRLPRRYWDSNAFLGILLGEQDKVLDCKAVLKAAEAGTIIIVTSALTLAEVVKIKGQPRLKREAEQAIREFFKHEWIVIIDCDRRIGEAARQLMWDYEFLNHKDAIHVATAMRSRVDQLDTFDEPLIKLSGALGNPPLVIGKPNLPEQIEFEYEPSEGSDDEQEEGQ